MKEKENKNETEKIFGLGDGGKLLDLLAGLSREDWNTVKNFIDINLDRLNENNKREREASSLRLELYKEINSLEKTIKENYDI